MILKTNDITMQFGGVTAVYKLNIEINDHEIIALIGPNGAGKTTAFNMITGVYTPTEGKVIYTDAQGQDIDITGQRPSEIAKLGIARTFQNIRLFKDLTVYENVLIANHLHLKSDFLSATLHLPWYMKEAKQMHRNTENGICATKKLRACLTASSAAWKLCAHWQPSRACYCLMNLRPV